MCESVLQPVSIKKKKICFQMERDMIVTHFPDENLTGDFERLQVIGGFSSL